MGKCCGVLAGCSVIMTIIVVAAGYFGYSYLITTGADFFASSIEASTRTMTEMTFDKDDQEEIMQAASALATVIRSGDINMIDAIRELTEQVEKQIFARAYLLAFKKQYLKASEKLAEENASQAAAMVDQILLAISNESLQNAQIENITTPLTYQHEEKQTQATGSSTITYHFTLLKPDLSPEQIAKTVEQMQKLIEENNLPVPDETFDSTAQLKAEIIQIFSDFRTAVKGDK